MHTDIYTLNTQYLLNTLCFSVLDPTKALSPMSLAKFRKSKKDDCPTLKQVRGCDGNSDPWGILACSC